MPQIVLFKSALHGFKFTPAPKRGEGGPMVVIDASTDWSDKARAWGGWDEVPDSISGNVNLEPADIAVQSFEMTPGKGLEKSAFEMTCVEFSSFQLFVPTKDDEERELRFKIRTTAKDACKILEAYGRTAGAATGKITAVYQESGGTQIDLTPDQQEELPLRGDALEEHKSRASGKKRDVQ